MKRSEMLVIIETYTLKMFPKLDVIDVAHFANMLLGIQERIGMLPPKHLDNHNKWFTDVEYKWDSEDE